MCDEIFLQATAKQVPRSDAPILAARVSLFFYHGKILSHDHPRIKPSINKEHIYFSRREPFCEFLFGSRGCDYAHTHVEA
jgi:hypothetical protein